MGYQQYDLSDPPENQWSAGQGMHATFRRRPRLRDDASMQTLSVPWVQPTNPQEEILALKKQLLRLQDMVMFSSMMLS